MTDERLDAALSRLADLMPCGHLRASIDPVAFVEEVTAEIQVHRRVKQMIWDQLEIAKRRNSGEIKELLERLLRG